MNEISKFSFYRSFSDMIEKLPTVEDKLELYEAIRLYAFYGELTEIKNPLIEFAFIQTKTIIDADVKRKTGGAPSGNSNASKGMTCRKNCKNYRKCLRAEKIICADFVDNSTEEESIFFDQNNQNNTKTNNVNVNDNDNVNDNVNDNANEICEIEEPKKEMIDLVVEATPEPKKNYGKEVFEVFKNAGLPCNNNNQISFLFADFKNAVQIINSNELYKGVTSGDVIQACKNYIEVLQDPNCWVTYKFNFVSLVKSDLFYKLLPSNFIKENFLTKKQDQKKEEVKTFRPAKSEVEFDHIESINNLQCPECKSTTWGVIDFPTKMYVCQKCKKVIDVTPEEV